MNVHVPPSTVTQSAPERDAGPWRFTVADVERMVEAGILREQDRVELINGELIAMPPKTPAHENPRNRLVRLLNRSLPEPYMAAGETTLRLDDDSYVEPDVIVYDDAMGVEALRGQTTLLIVEVSVSSLDYDLNRKPATYAAHGVRELWVVDVEGRRVRVHRSPRGDAYSDVTDSDWTAALCPLFRPELRASMADLVGD